MDSQITPLWLLLSVTVLYVGQAVSASKHILYINAHIPRLISMMAYTLQSLTDTMLLAGS